MNSIDIIANFKNQFEYVEDYENIIEYLESLNLSLTEINEILHEILKWNIEKEKELKENLNNIGIPLIKDEKNEKTKEKEDVEEKKIDTYYKKLIEECDDTDFITEILPSTNNTAFEEIIYSTLLSFYKELVCTNEIKKSAQDELEKEYLNEEEQKLKQIIKIIKDYYNEETTEEELTPQEKQNTKIIYMKNTNDTPYYLIDTENINPLDMKDIESVIENLKNGINRHEKKFTNHEDLKGISSIRKKDIRVIFTRIDNSIIILGAFVKRFQNPLIYRDLLKRRNKTFKNRKEEIKENLDNQEYLKYHNKLTKSIIKQKKNNK